jgi:hypothetical protein
MNDVLKMAKKKVISRGLISRIIMNDVLKRTKTGNSRGLFSRIIMNDALKMAKKKLSAVV